MGLTKIPTAIVNHHFLATQLLLPSTLYCSALLASIILKLIVVSYLMWLGRDEKIQYDTVPVGSRLSAIISHCCLN